ncbi:hypothetical protein L3V77_20880 [Vibrio sp. DW001]|uniref:hypothetical protein n=1 Tax=Vibrio sp. DW001 TaxID=2912315 RepID=UPI0023AF0DD6|nr:hypothetical protein [Vibrio sp. DW001]WED29863.1 hypothetical protein L3V77_20880 [Vibrio sp. DW001]
MYLVDDQRDSFVRNHVAMASSEDVAYLRMHFSPFDSSKSAVCLKKITHLYTLFAGEQRGIVHPRLIYEYLCEFKPLPKQGYDNILELLTAH